MTLVLNNISLQLGGATLVKPFSATIAPGEILTLMGASGSGKSSVLSYIGGDLANAFTAQGEVLLNGREITLLQPHQRRVARLFQDDLLFPHMTVGENLLFSLPRHSHESGNPDFQHESKRKAWFPAFAGMTDNRVAMLRSALKRAELEGFEDRPPHTLSGGQRARVALMRALLAKPDAILLDEPFSKLDQDLRAATRGYVFAHLAERGIPALLVTHDRADAPEGGRVLKLVDGEARDA